MTAHEKLILLRHLRTAKRHYQRMIDLELPRPIRDDPFYRSALADVGRIIERVETMETKG